MTAPTTSAPTTDNTPDSPHKPAAGDLFDQDTLPTPPARPPHSCAPCSPR